MDRDALGQRDGCLVSLQVGVDPRELTRVVEHLTGAAPASGWQIEELHRPVASATLGIWRVAGDGWSTVLKLVGLEEGGHPNWQAGAAPEHWYYWRREVLAYQSGLLAFLTGGLRAPRCYLASDRSPTTVALWLEDVVAPSALSWPLERYRLAARHLLSGISWPRARCRRRDGSVAVGGAPISICGRFAEAFGGWARVVPLLLSSTEVARRLIDQDPDRGG